MNVDPLASMRCWVISVELGGREYDIPALPAADWFPVLVSADVTGVLDLLRSSPDDLEDQLLSGEISGKELGEVLTEAIEEATGRPAHAAFVLAIVAADQWPMIGGTLAQTGFRWDVQPIGAALDAIHSIVVSSLPEEPRKKFLQYLEDEHLTTGRRRPIDRAKVTAEFETMAGPRPAPAPPGATAPRPPEQSIAGPSGSARPRTPRPPRPPRPAVRSSGPRTRPAPPG